MVACQTKSIEEGSLDHDITCGYCAIGGINATAENRIFVRVPDLFVSFLKETPVLNPNYPEVRGESEEVVSRECEVSSHLRNAIKKCNWAYLAAIVAPKATRERYRTLCDWGNWVFPFDDLFDEGDLRDNYAEAKIVMEQLSMGFKETSAEEIDSRQRPPIVRFHDTIVKRIRALGSKAILARYTKGMEAYCYGTLEQVREVQDRSLPTVEDVLVMRRRSVCVSPLFALVEYGQQLDLPVHIFEDPIIRDIEDIGIDITLLHNDFLSYWKEEADKVPHNMVAVCRMHGMTGQQAFDHMGSLLDRRHEELTKAIDRLPRWNARVDVEVARYIEGIRDVIKANLYWSFESRRFLNEEQKRRWRTRCELDVLADPRFLAAV